MLGHQASGLRRDPSGSVSCKAGQGVPAWRGGGSLPRRRPGGSRLDVTIGGGCGEGGFLPRHVQPVLYPADPRPPIGTSFLWPSCLRSGLKSPADWRSPFHLPGAGQTPCVCFTVCTSLPFGRGPFSPFAWCPLPPSSLWGDGEPFPHGDKAVALQWRYLAEKTRGLGVCSLSAALVRNVPTSQRGE